jgi:DNA-binding beta-propeller fold protein YncE
VLDDSLFVAHFSTEIDEVGKYNAITGAKIKAKFVTQGLDGPNGLAVLGNTLFVSSIGGTGTVGKYNAITGAVINATFITALDRPPTAIAVKPKAHEHGYGVVDELFVADRDTVGKYDATTGKVINAKFITGLHDPRGLAVLGDTLFVTNFESGGDSGTVGKYDATTGATINAKFITGLEQPQGIAVK